MSKDLGKYPIKFKIADIGETEGELIRIKAPKTAEAVWRSLPITSKVSLWKDEVYFSIGIGLGREKPSKTVERGDIAYWPMGDALCVFFGETQPYSEVNICGKITGNIEVFSKVKPGQTIILEKAE